MNKVKALGLAVVACLALSAMVASAASAATPFHSEVAPTTIDGIQVGAGDILHVEAGTTNCAVATYTGVAVNQTEETLTVHPTYAECELEPIGHMEIITTGCDYRFHGGETTGEGSPPTTAHGTVDIVCTGGNLITINASVFGVSKCVITVGSQNGLEGIIYTNEGAGANRNVIVDMDIEGIAYTQTEGHGFGRCELDKDGKNTTTKHSYNNGRYTGQAEVIGTNEAQEQKGIWVS